jgi:hypothetical protein
MQLRRDDNNNCGSVIKKLLIKKRNTSQTIQQFSTGLSTSPPVLRRLRNRGSALKPRGRGLESRVIAGETT